MLRSHKPRIDFQSASLNGVIVEPFAELCASQLPHFQPAPLDSIFPFQAFQHDYAVRNALQLQVMSFTSAIIQKQDSVVASGKVSLQTHDLTAITQRIAGQHAPTRAPLQSLRALLLMRKGRHKGTFAPDGRLPAGTVEQWLSSPCPDRL